MSLGPKTYSLQYVEQSTRKFITKCKGITISSENSGDVCAEKMIDILNGVITKIETKQERFCSGKYGGVKFLSSIKKIRDTYRKRRILSDGSFRTLPWGYKN